MSADELKPGPARAADELKRLAARKAAVRARIAGRRDDARAALEGLRGPAALVEKGAALWQAIPGKAKWVVVPAGLFVARTVAKRAGGPLALLRYAPLAASVVKTVAGWRKRAPAP